jgi:type II secretory pathway pseudopilin PulG
LIELLTVISIIGLLVGIGVGAAGVANRKMKEARVRAELNMHVTAIEAYKSALGFYPPDNNKNGTNFNPAVNQLYYELSGTYSSNQGAAYRTADQTTWTDSEVFEEVFNTQGIVNSGVTPNQPRQFLLNLKPLQHQKVKVSSKADQVELLVVPVRWPARWPSNPAFKSPYDRDAKLKEVNPWRYVSTHPTNNPEGFDLWAEVVFGKQRRIIGNWKE